MSASTPTSTLSTEALLQLGNFKRVAADNIDTALAVVVTSKPYVELRDTPYNVVANNAAAAAANVAAINSAIVTYSGTKTCLVFPAGDIYLDRAVASPGRCITMTGVTDLTLTGQGAYATRLIQKNTGDTGSSHVFRVDGCSRIEFANFTILQDTIDNPDPAQQNHLLTIMNGSIDIIGHHLIFGKAIGDQLRLVGGSGGPGNGVVKNIRFTNFLMHGAGVVNVASGRTGARSGIGLQSGFSNVEMGNFFIDGAQNSPIDGEPTGTGVCEYLNIHDGFIDNSLGNTSAAVSIVGNSSTTLKNSVFNNVTIILGKLGIRYTSGLTISNLKSICAANIPGTPTSPNILVRDTNDSLYILNSHVERTGGGIAALLDVATASNVHIHGGTWIQATAAEPITMEAVSALRVTGTPKIKYTGSSPSTRYGLLLNAVNDNSDDAQIDGLDVECTSGTLRAAVSFACRTPRTMSRLRAVNINGRGTVTSCLYLSTNTTGLDQTPYVTGMDGFVTNAWKQVDAADNAIATIFPIVAGNPGEICIHSSEAAPEGVVTALQGSLCVWKNADSTISYSKETGTGNTGWVAADLTPALTGRLLGVQILTGASGTYTPTTGTKRTRIMMVGGGGGGAGALGGITQSSWGGGGASGSYFEKYIDPSATVTGGAFACGGAGGGGDGTPSNGTAGGDSTVVVQGTTYTAKGGPGGIAMSAGSTTATVLGGGFVTGTSAGDVVATQVPGGTGFRLAAGVGDAGCGGSSPWGAGGQETLGEANGISAQGNGGGGGGAGSTTATAKTGGAGTIGKIIIYEYS